MCLAVALGSYRAAARLGPHIVDSSINSVVWFVVCKLPGYTHPGRSDNRSLWRGIAFGYLVVFCKRRRNAFNVEQDF